MKPVYQTITVGPLSNCLQAAIASLLEMPLEDVPNFNEYSSVEWYQRMLDWFEGRGLGLLRVWEAGLSRAFSRSGYYLTTVKSPRGDFYHAMVSRNGEIVHDPYPGGNGEHNGIVSHDVIFPLDVAKWEMIGESEE